MGKLPKGCIQCVRGLKSVFLATGVCSEGCFYCPLSSARKGKAVSYVNDALVREGRDVLLEVLASRSKGVGITGGDPILVVDYVADVIKLLKGCLGQEFHVHLYTTGKHLSENALRKLVDAGLNELRIHVTGAHSWRALEIALNYSSLDVGIENPAVPDFETLKNIVIEGFKLGVDFINLNEMEVSELNYVGMISRGLRVNPDGLTVAGSREAALQVLSWVLKEELPVNLHYCPARFKDKYQFRRRLIRRFKGSKRVYESINSEGLVKWIEVPFSDDDLLNSLILSDLAYRRGSTVYLSIRLAKHLPLNESQVVEAYPTTPRMILNTYETRPHLSL